jgi:hypothetical protein
MGEPVENPKARAESSGEKRSRRVPWLAVLAIGVALSTTLGSIGLAGIWDPPELLNAEYGRRIAHDVFGATSYAAPNEGPLSREALGRGELPFLAIGLGFRIFGLSSPGGRALLALCALAGIAALHLLLRRLHSARAAWLSTLVLGSMPLYFVHARTMLGDIVGMAADAAAMAGMGLCVFAPSKRSVRAAYFALGALGLVCGFWSRGILVGVAVPSLGVGLAWLALASAGTRSDRSGDVLGAGTLLFGTAAAIAGAVALTRAPEDVFSLWLAATPAAVRPLPSFDIVIRDLGHALFPWSALLLPAIARCATLRILERDYPQQALVLTLLATAAAASIAEAEQARVIGLQSFVAPAALAGLCALSLDELDDTPPARWFGLSVAALLTLLLLDFRNFPEKGLVAFSVSDSVFPAAFANRGFSVLAGVSFPLAIAFVLFAGETRASSRSRVFRAREYLGWLRLLRRVWWGALWFIALAVGSACLAFEAILALSDRFHVAAFESVSELSRALVHAGCLLSFTLFLGPLAARFARDLLRLVPLRRGVALVSAFSVGAAILSFGYYTALASELSPKRAFDIYKREAAGAPLGLLGVNAAVARYQTGVSGRDLRDADRAAAFLLAEPAPRYVALRANELAGLNAVFRAHTTPRRNVPVFDSHAGEIVLAANRLPASRASDNPFDRWVTSEASAPLHPLDVDLGGKLDVLGWDVFDRDGTRVSALSPGTRYEFAIYYRVNQRVSGNWDTFLHIDGFQRRFNGDHATLGGHYRFSLWLPNDFIVDRYEFALGPEFSRGSYHVYFGLYSGSRRLEVRRGAHEDDRIVAGTIDVK